MFTLSIDGSSLPATVEEGPGCVLRATILDNDGMFPLYFVYLKVYKIVRYCCKF